MTIQPYVVTRTYDVYSSDEERHGPASAYRWCHTNAGVCAPERDWHMTSRSFFPLTKLRTDTYRFRDKDVAMLFKLMWGGR